MTEGKNFAGIPDPDVDGETEFSRCNFSQPEPVEDGETFVGVLLFPGDNTPRTFTRCNLVNCDVPPGSTIIDCNTTVRRKRVLTSHDEIIIDGGEPIVIDIFHKIIYGRLTAPGQYVYLSSPTMIEILED